LFALNMYLIFQQFLYSNPLSLSATCNKTRYITFFKWKALFWDNSFSPQQKRRSRFVTLMRNKRVGGIASRVEHIFSICSGFIIIDDWLHFSRRHRNRSLFTCNILRLAQQKSGKLFCKFTKKIIKNTLNTYKMNIIPFSSCGFAIYKYWLQRKSVEDFIDKLLHYKLQGLIPVHTFRIISVAEFSVYFVHGPVSGFGHFAAPWHGFRHLDQVDGHPPSVFFHF